MSLLVSVSTHASDAYGREHSKGFAREHAKECGETPATNVCVAYADSRACSLTGDFGREKERIVLSYPVSYTARLISANQDYRAIVVSSDCWQ